MSLRDQIESDLISAMKAREEVKLSTLRMLKSAIGAFEVSGKEKVVATEDDVLAILKREVKKRKESIRQFEEGGRQDLVASEQLELDVLKEYMPEMIGEEQIRQVVEEVVQSMGVTGMSDMGKVMGASMGKLNGQADGTLVKDVVMSVLRKL
jgi:uncharacterized protein